MKKRILSILLAITMIATMLPLGGVTVFADGEVCQIGPEKYASVTAALNAAHTSETAETPTEITLIANTTENITISAGRYITLDLNGFVLKGIGDTSVIKNEGTLTIIDSNPSVVHYYTVDSKHKWVWNDSTTTGATNYSALTARPTANDVIAVPGGCITGGYSTATAGGGGICSNGDLTLNGGNVIGNEITRYGGGISITNNKTATINGGRILGNITTGTKTAYGNGGGIAVGYGMPGTIIINSGEVCFNTANRYGGGVYNNTGLVTVTGGVIAYNRAVNNGGGGLCSDGTMELFGGTVIKNTAKQKGGGMFHNCTSFYLGGDVIIEDNIIEGDVTSNVYFNNSTRVSFDETHLPQQGMSIGVTLSSPPAAGNGKQFTNGSNADYSAYFFSDSTAYYVNLVDGTTKYLELRALAPGNYAINVIPPKNGTVTVSPKEAAKGTEITLTVVPNEGYQLKSLLKATYYDGSQNQTCQLTQDTQDETKYTFTMPAYAVTVSAEFEETPAHTHSFTDEYVSNDDGTYSRKCTGCNEVDTENKITVTDYRIINKTCETNDGKGVKMGHQYKIVNSEVINDEGRAIICLTQADLEKITEDTVTVVGGDKGKQTTFTLDCAYTYFYAGDTKYEAGKSAGLEDIAAFLIIDHDAAGGAISGFGYYRVYDGSADSEGNFILDALYVNPNN